MTGAYLLTFIEQRYQGSEGKKAGESRSDPACIRSATNRAMYCINQVHVPTCVNNNQEGGDVPNYLRDTFTYSSPHSRSQHRARRSAACSPCGVVGTWWYACKTEVLGPSIGHFVMSESPGRGHMLPSASRVSACSDQVPKGAAHDAASAAGAT